MCRQGETAPSKLPSLFILFLFSLLVLLSILQTESVLYSKAAPSTVQKFSKTCWTCLVQRHCSCSKTEEDVHLMRWTQRTKASFRFVLPPVLHLLASVSFPQLKKLTQHLGEEFAERNNKTALAFICYRPPRSHTQGVIFQEALLCAKLAVLDLVGKH